jgi:hypothetical protein
MTSSIIFPLARVIISIAPHATGRRASLSQNGRTQVFDTISALRSLANSKLRGTNSRYGSKGSGVSRYGLTVATSAASAEPPAPCPVAIAVA